MKRGRRKTKKEESTLLTALRFIYCAQRAIGSIEQTHCVLYGNKAQATNGVVSAAHPIQEDIQIAPHTRTLIDALEQAPGQIALTALDNGTLQVSSDDFRAIVPCVPLAQIPTIFADTPQFLCNDQLLPAMFSVGTLIAEKAEKVVNGALKLSNGCAIASNGHVILQAWHGVEIPGVHLVPKEGVKALEKSLTLTPYRLGVSPDGSSLTVWLESGAWIKTQLYAQGTSYPDLERFLNTPAKPVAVPSGLWDVAKRLTAFSLDGKILFTGTEAIVFNGESYARDTIANMPKICFSIKALLEIAEFAKTIHFGAASNLTLFFGENIRGAIRND